MAAVAAKALTPALEKPVQGGAGQGQGGNGGLEPGCGLARGGCQLNAAVGLLVAHGLHHGQHRAGLTRTWAALQEHQLAFQHGLHGLLLLGIQVVLGRHRLAEFRAGVGVVLVGWMGLAGAGHERFKHVLALGPPAAPHHPIALYHQGPIGAVDQG